MKLESRIRTLFAIVAMCAWSVTATGQVLRGSIAGTVNDDTGAALPGVTVTVTSPALQVPQIVRISDGRGEYQVTDLPAGTYRVMYELTGFATLVREGIVLTTGFAARIDADLKVATLAETVTVSGESPLVDVTSTRGGTTVSQDLIATIPNNKNVQDLTVLVGGLVVLGPPMTGEITSGRGGFRGIKTYGQSGRDGSGGTQMIEGVKMNENEVPDFNAFEEADVKTFGNTADVDIPGLAVQYVVKSGGNQFHGKFSEIVQHHRFQSDNVDAALRAQGISSGNSIQFYNDFGADLGGRVIRDKLWFYTAFRDYRNRAKRLGYAKDPGPDGAYGTLDDTPAFTKARHESTTFKISYQLNPQHKFISFGQYNPDYSERPSDRFTPAESNTMNDQYSRETKPIEWQAALNNRLVVDLLWGFGGYKAVTYYAGAGWPADSGEPARFNRTTGQNTGPAFGEVALRGPMRNQFAGRVNYLPDGALLGSHELETGYRVWLGTTESKGPFDPKYGGIGEYRLIYDTVGGVPYQPVEMAARNAPNHSVSHQNLYAGYLMDSWRPTTRLTVNLGVRYERQIHWVPPQVKVQGTFGTSGTFPRVDAGTWTAWAPRAGAAFDLSGDGKTVVKATYGWFNHDFGVNGYAGAFNQNSSVTYTYRWNDRNRDGNYQPGEVNLDLNGPDFLSISGATSNRINPDLKQPHTHEVTAALERELGNGMSIRGLYVYKQIVDDYLAVNALRPNDVYNRAFSRRDPGPDGLANTVDDGEMFTIYDYNPAFRGAAFVANMNTNTSADHRDRFQNAELTLTKRATGRWFANTSVLATKNHRWLVQVPQSPNDLVNALDETWEWNYRLAAGYTLPFGVNASTLYSAYSGFARQRTNVFRAVDPAGGPAFPSSSTITMRMEPYGASRLPTRHVLNLRGEKSIVLRDGRRFTAGVDAFNALNSNTAWSEQGIGTVNEVSGPTYGYVLRIVYPRILRFTVGFEF